MLKDEPGVAEESVSRRLAVLEGIEAIRALKARYAEAVDRSIEQPGAEAAAAVADLFSEDARTDYGQFGRPDGRAQILEFFHTTMPAVTSWARHHATNPIIEVNGDSATGRWYAIVYAVLRSDPAAGPQTLWVRYEDTYVKTEQGWKIRTCLVHFDAPASPA